MKLTVEVDWELSDKIVLENLRASKKSFEEDLENPDANVFFWGDPDKDRAEIQKHIDAINLIIDWYKAPDDE